MKSMAQSHIWWPKLDADLEKTTLTQCIKTRNAPPPAPFIPWTWPLSPWKRIHIDFATHATTGATPAKLFLQRELCTRPALVHPDISLQVTNNQAKMKSYYDRHTKLRELSPGDRILDRDDLSKLKWRPGSVLERRAPLSYCVQLDDSRIWHRHIDDLLLGALQKQSQVPQASSRACRDISSDSGEISNYFTNDSRAPEHSRSRL